MTGVKGVTLATGGMNFIADRKLFVSSEGSRINQKFIRSAAGIVANATGDDDSAARIPVGFGGQWELTAGGFLLSVLI